MLASPYPPRPVHTTPTPQQHLAHLQTSNIYPNGFHQPIASSSHIPYPTPPPSARDSSSPQPFIACESPMNSHSPFPFSAPTTPISQQAHFFQHHHSHSQSSGPSSGHSLPVTPAQCTPIPAPQRHNTTPNYSCSPKPITASSFLSKTACSLKRASPHRKPTQSNPSKQVAVQLSLEKKVQKAQAFHAFFVPTAKALPPAPPSSPNLHPVSAPQFGEISCHSWDLNEGTKSEARGLGMNIEALSMDYFAGWDQPKIQDQWIDHAQTMHQTTPRLADNTMNFGGR